MTNISAAAQGRRVIKYTSKNDPRPRRSAAKSKNFAKEGDSSDNDPTPYLFQAINNNNPQSSSRGHREKRASKITCPRTPTRHKMAKGATQKMPPPQKLGPDSILETRPGPAMEVDERNRVHERRRHTTYHPIHKTSTTTITENLPAKRELPAKCRRPQN